MKIISFAWTTPALLAGKKTVTRRAWKNSHAFSFKKDEIIQAYDKSPRCGGRRVATIQLTAIPILEPTTLLRDADWEDEGFAYLSSIGEVLRSIDIWHEWTTYPCDLWTVRFKLIDLTTLKSPTL